MPYPHSCVVRSRIRFDRRSPLWSPLARGGFEAIMDALERFDAARAITMRTTALSPIARNGLQFPHAKVGRQ